ncbi:MAG: hypothetical protein ACOYT8_02525 [Candidatus Dependentiae bacterium]
MKKIILKLLLLCITQSIHAMSHKSIRNSCQSLEGNSYSEFDVKNFVKAQVDSRITQFFANKFEQFTTFESIKDYIKGGETSYTVRPDGRKAIQYHCPYPDCKTTSKANAVGVASCFLGHYANDFFQCSCGIKYTLISSLLAHIKSCKKIDLSNLSSELSYSLESSESSDTAETIIENASDNEELNYYELGILNKPDEMGIENLICYEDLEVNGVDPKLIFTATPSQYQTNCYKEFTH